MNGNTHSFDYQIGFCIIWSAQTASRTFISTMIECFAGRVTFIATIGVNSIETWTIIALPEVYSNLFRFVDLLSFEFRIYKYKKLN